MTGETAAGTSPGRARWAGRAGGWLRGSRGGLLAVALVVGAGSGLGAVAFRDLIYFFTWLATGHAQFGQQGRVGSAHFPWLGLGFFIVIPVIGGLIYGPLIYRYAREARGHGVPEVMIAVAENGGRIRPQVAAVKSVASAICIGAGGSVGREGPIVQIGSALASSLGQWVRMPENRLRILVACGAAGGIAATFNAPITGVFFGVEIILRELSVEAVFTVMLSAMIADLLSRQFLGSAPFLSGLPSGIALHHLSSYLLVAALAVVAALLGLAFAKILYATEDLCDRVWKNRPEWARPAVGGIALGLLLLAIPQMYGVGYPVMYKAVGGSYALWFLIVLAAGKIIACSLTIGIGGSGGVFAPSLFIGATSGMAFGEIAGHLLGPAAGQPALYAVVGMGAVFASAARAPLTSVASVVEMTGDFTLTLPVMLAVAIATATSRALSYGTIYTTKLLRRGTDIDHPQSADPFEDLTAADAMRPFAAPLTIAAEPPGPPGRSGPARAPLPGPVTQQRNPQVLFAGESLTQALRQLELYGRDGLPVLAADGQHLQGWITSQNVLQAVARRMRTARAATAQAQRAPGPALPGLRAPAREAPTPLRGYQILEITIPAGSPAAGRTLGDITWPHEWIPVTVMDNQTLRDAGPGITLAPGDRVNLLAREQAAKSPWPQILRIGDAREAAVRKLLRCGAHGSGSADHCRSSLTEGADMGKRRWLAAGSSLLAAAIGLFGAATAASASTASPVVGYTYIDGNTATANTIDGFARHADGSVTPLPGSPFAAGGAGLGSGLASQGAIQATPDGRYLLAADAGSNQISVLRVTAGGVPVLAGQPVSSGGVRPVSIAVSRSGLVYVANSGAGGSGYSGFRLHLNGSLTAIPGTTVTVPDDAGLGDVFFNATGDHLIGTRTGTSQIDSFVVLPGGHLLAAKGSPITGQGLGQLGAEFSPANPAQLFVSNAHNGTGLGTVSAYRDSFSGQLSPIGSSPYADGQTAPCWVEISHNGKYLFTVNTGSANVSSYAINPDGSLALIGSTPISGGGADIDARLSPDGKTLSVDGSGNHILSVFAVHGGTLTELPSSPTPLPAGGAPAGIVNI